MSDTFLEDFERRRKEQRDKERRFEIAGEMLMLRPWVPAEVGRRFVAMQARVSRQEIALHHETAKINGEPNEDATGAILALLDQRVTDEEMIAAADDAALACLDDTCHEAWARLRDPGNPNALSWQELFDVTRYLLGRCSVIPTDAPTGSSGGRTSTETKSKAASSSRAATSKASR